MISQKGNIFYQPTVAYLFATNSCGAPADFILPQNAHEINRFYAFKFNIIDKNPLP